MSVCSRSGLFGEVQGIADGSKSRPMARPEGFEPPTVCLEGVAGKF